MCIVLKTHTHTGHLLSAVRPVFELINRPQWSAWDGDIKKKKKKCEHRVCIRERHSLQVWKVNPVWKTIKHAFFVLPDWSYYFCFFVLYLFTKVIFCIFHIFWHIWLLVVDVGLLMPWQCVYDIGLWLKIWVNSFGDCLTFSQEVHKSGWNKKLPNVLPWHLF